MRHSSFTSENQGQPVSNHKLYVHTQCGQTVYDILFRFLRIRDLTKVKPALNECERYTFAKYKTTVTDITRVCHLTLVIDILNRWMV